MSQKDSNIAGKQIETMQKENVCLHDTLSNAQLKHDRLEQVSKDMNSACRKTQKENEILRCESEEHIHQVQSEINGHKK